MREKLIKLQSILIFNIWTFQWMSASDNDKKKDDKSFIDDTLKMPKAAARAVDFNVIARR